MTEKEARAWMVAQFSISDVTQQKLDAFAAMVAEENSRQNLVSAASLPHLWARHIVDSAQLLRHAPDPGRSWLDLGSGPGFPGIVLGILHEGPVHLVESRKRRATFLQRIVDALVLDNATVHACQVEALVLPPVNVITARAFAPLPKLFALAHRFSTKRTIWVLPKGQSARRDLESVSGTWQGMFHVERSATDARAEILIARTVKPMGKA